MKLIIIPTIICIVSSALLGITYNMTKDKIRTQEEMAELEALSFIIPEAENFLKEEDYYKALGEDGSIIGYVCIGERKGYSSVLKIMVGVDTKGDVIGIKIVSQNETPGLGGRVNEVAVRETIWDIIKGKKAIKNEPWFQAQFRNKKMDEIQAITGATITSNAVINAVKETVAGKGTP